jgi:hypothetical protein
MLRFVKRLSDEFRDPYTLRTFDVSLVRPKLEYASCVWWHFYTVYVNRIARVQSKSVLYALRGLGWTNMYDLPPHVLCSALRR